MGPCPHPDLGVGSESEVCKGINLQWYNFRPSGNWEAWLFWAVGLSPWPEMILLCLLLACWANPARGPFSNVPLLFLGVASSFLCWAAPCYSRILGLVQEHDCQGALTYVCRRWCFNMSPVGQHPPPPGGGWTAQVECRPFQIGDGGIFWSSFCLFFHLHALSAAQWLFSTSFPFWARWALLVSRRQHLSISPMRHPLKLHWASSQLSWPPGLLLPSSPDANAACGPHCTPWGIKSGHLQWIGGADATRLEGGQNDSAFQMWVSLYPRSSLVEYLVLNFYNLKSMHKTQKSFKKEEYGQ